MSDPKSTAAVPSSENKEGAKPAVEKKKLPQLGALEDDDEFEVGPALFLEPCLSLD
jgi:hypothetical protein